VRIALADSFSARRWRSQLSIMGWNLAPSTEARQALCASSGQRTRSRKVAFPQIRDEVWSGAGSNRRPSAFQVNRAERYADLRKRTSPTSETALGGRCEIHANRHQVPRPSGSTATIHAARLVDGHRPDVVATIAGRVALEDQGVSRITMRVTGLG
jgi:hypothetical protein